MPLELSQPIFGTASRLFQTGLMLVEITQVAGEA
jgi:hypothetical protein